MVKLFPVIGCVLSITSMILLAVGLATNHWVEFDSSSETLNPTAVNTQLETSKATSQTVTDSTRHISYAAKHYGLWIGCMKESRGAISCAYVGSKCYANVCWIRKSMTTSTETCQDGRMTPITNCTAYQVVRAFIVMGMLILIVGVSTQVVSLITLNRAMAMLAGVIVFTAGLFVMIAFAIFYSEEMAKNGVNQIAHLGYSFNLIIATWPIALIAGLFSCCAASMGLRHKEVSDYSASNY